MDTDGRNIRSQVGQSVWGMFGRKRKSEQFSKDLGRGFGLFGRSSDTDATDLAGIFEDCEIWGRMATESPAISCSVLRETNRPVSPDSEIRTTGTKERRISSFNPSRDQVKDEHEKLKYYAARSVWKKRNRKTPSGVRTWSEWFEDKFKISLQDYAKEQRSKISRTR